MTLWFAFQRSPRGLVPVTFAERPDQKRTWSRDVVKETIREVPVEWRDASLSALAAWARGEKTSASTN